MAEDLDDGELWLPSDIFPEVGVRSRLHHHRLPASATLRPANHSDLAYVDDLAHQLAAFGLLDRPHHSFPALKPNACLPSRPFSEGFRPAARFEPVECEAFGYDGYRAPVSRSASSLGSVTGYGVGSRPLYFNQGKPTLAQVESFALGRARVLQRPQQRHGPNRYFPVRLAGSGRECGGTGVFLPRVTNNDVRKKPGLRSGEPQQKQATRYAVVGRQGMSLQPPSEMGLPQDWTY